jgi:hypothetical protein
MSEAKFKKKIRTLASSPGSAQRRKARTSASLTYNFGEGRSALFVSDMLGQLARAGKFKGASMYYLLLWLTQNRKEVTETILSQPVSNHMMLLWGSAEDRESPNWNFRTPGAAHSTQLHNGLYHWAEDLGLKGNSHKVSIATLLFEMALRHDRVSEWMAIALARG